MEARSPKQVPKKASPSDRSVSTKKAQLHKKKKKQHKKTDGKDTWKSSTSPEADRVMSDLATDVESDVSATSKEKPLITIRHPQVMAVTKQSQRKHSNNSPKPNKDEKHQGHTMTTSTWAVRFCNVSSNKGSNKATSKKSSTSLNSFPSRLHLESLRWDYELSDLESEQDRIRVYKLNRRKRYLATFRQNYSEWLASGVTGDGSSEIQDSVIHERGSDQSSQRKVTATRGLGQETVIQGFTQGILSKIPYTKINQDIMIKC